MEHMPEFNSDRREFFRINDTVFIDISSLDEEQADRLGQVIRSPIHNDKNQEKQQLSALQTAFNHINDQINQTDRDVARALRILDDKLNLISQTVRRQQNRSNDSEAVEVNLSGGGIAFLTAEEFSSKSAFEINIELRPSGDLIHTVANVIACNRITDAPEETPYLLRLVFTHMSECDRNLLVKHTLSRQAEILRADHDT
ncbi:MAG: PilZ domain-containing protein [Methylophagaceae bacterium]